MRTEHARAAAAIRKELKKAFPVTKFRVTSHGYSGGCSVTAYWDNGPTTEQVGEYTGKYQYGHFDGMDDSYHYSNTKEDLPQARFVFTNRHVTPTVMEAAFEVAKERYADFDGVKDLDEYHSKISGCARQWLSRYLSSIDLTKSCNSWDILKAMNKIDNCGWDTIEA